MSVNRRNFGIARFDAPDFVDDLTDKVRAIVASVWPEAAAGGIYNSELIRTIPVARINYPCAVIETGNARATGEYATDADAYLVPVRVYYATYNGHVQQGIYGAGGDVVSTIEVIRRRLGQFRRALNNTPQEIVKVVRNVGYFLSPEDNDTNKVMEAKNDSLRSGYFEFVVLVSESFTTTPGEDWVPPVFPTYLNGPQQ